MMDITASAQCRRSNSVYHTAASRCWVCGELVHKSVYLLQRRAPGPISWYCPACEVRWTTARAAGGACSCAQNYEPHSVFVI